MHLVMLDTIIIFTEKLIAYMHHKEGCEWMGEVSQDHLERSAVACPFGCGIVVNNIERAQDSSLSQPTNKV